MRNLLALLCTFSNVLTFLHGQGIAGNLTNFDHCSTKQKVELFTDHLEIQIEDGQRPLKVNFLWLRDHSRSDDTYNKRSHQRVKSILDISENVKPLTYTYCDSHLHIHWSDGSEYEYSLEWIRKVMGESKDSSMQMLWNQETISDKIVQVDCNEMMIEKKGLTKFFEGMEQNGFALLTECQSTKSATMAAADRICPLHESIFGKLWEIEVRDQTSNLTRYEVADTNSPQEFHTDSSYLTDPNGYQIFHILKAAKEGGDSLLIDGIYVAEKMRAEHPDMFEVLANTEVTWEFLKFSPPYMFHQHKDRTFRLDLAGNILQIRYNNYQRAVLTGLGLKQTEEFYSAYRMFTEMLSDPANQLWRKLQPGTILFFDNWRMLHGRSSFQGARKLTNGWFKRETWLNAARINKFFD